MARLSAGRAVALAADELAEASRALQAVERALMADALPADRDAFPRDLQHLDLLAQSIEELRLYLDGLAREIGMSSPTLDLSGPLAAVKLGAMRARLSEAGPVDGPDGGPESGHVDLF